MLYIALSNKTLKTVAAFTNGQRAYSHLICMQHATTMRIDLNLLILTEEPMHLIAPNKSIWTNCGKHAWNIIAHRTAHDQRTPRTYLFYTLFDANCWVKYGRHVSSIRSDASPRSLKFISILHLCEHESAGTFATTKSISYVSWQVDWVCTRISFRYFSSKRTHKCHLNMNLYPALHTPCVCVIIP